MLEDALFKRMKASAQDFWAGVRPSLESQLNATILPLEQLQQNEAVKAFDQAGIDAFYLDKKGNLRGLASRVNYSRFKNAPAFTFRYARWNATKKEWDHNREYQRKLDAANNPQRFTFFPELHVESFSQKKGSGLISWSYVARTQELMNYIHANLENKAKVQFFEPSIGERRQVVVVPVEAFAKDNQITEVKIKL
jgi:hypothetical protein